MPVMASEWSWKMIGHARDGLDADQKPLRDDAGARYASVLLWSRELQKTCKTHGFHTINVLELHVRIDIIA